MKFLDCIIYDPDTDATEPISLADIDLPTQLPLLDNSDPFNPSRVGIVDNLRIQNNKILGDVTYLIPDGLAIGLTKSYNEKGKPWEVIAISLTNAPSCSNARMVKP